MVKNMKRKVADPLILEIKGNSLDDGPGIRSVVFFKGCPLNCQWCHNPESKKAKVELSFDSQLCIGCNSCIDVCKPKALSKENENFIDRSKCTLCFDCVEVCPSTALSKVGMEISVSDLVEKVIKDKPFYETSKGGVTLSGGEATLNLEYLSAFVRRLYKEEINVLLETCGFFNLDQFFDKVYPFINNIYFDLKIIDESNHEKFCGTSNKKILNNFIELYKKYLDGGVPILPRTPLVPGITDTFENLNAIADFLISCNAKKISLLPYNPLWYDKTVKIGVENKMSKNKETESFMDAAKIAEYKNIFTDKGIEVI